MWNILVIFWLNLRDICRYIHYAGAVFAVICVEDPVWSEIVMDKRFHVC